MSGCFGQLDQVLGQQLAGLTALKNWLPRKVELLQAGRLTELEALVAKEEETLARLQQLEGERRVLAGMAARELGHTATPSLPGLVQLAPLAERPRLQERLRAIEAVAHAWREARATLMPRLARSLDDVHLTLDALAELSARRGPDYQASTGPVPGAVTMMVDRTA
ncbi:MAG: flagellar export chaperone FlgN [Candidatus Sericytochromatia bacterium]|nr:flagellar export chaperone FlgN [Candidatus Sericytochromatia bacterium]